MTMPERLEGGCHCGAVRFHVPVPAGRPRLLMCNCSICDKTGYLHWIIDRADFTLLSGGAMLQDYRFGTGAARHLFCRRCGIKAFYHPRSHPHGISVNARALDADDWREWPVELFDGRNWDEARARLDD